MTFFQNPQVIFVLFVFVYYNNTHISFDQHSHTRRSLTPWQFCSALCVCGGGGGLKGCRGKFKRCGLDFGIPIKVQWVYCFFFCLFVCLFVLFCFVFRLKLFFSFFFPIGVGCLHAYSKYPNIKKKMVFQEKKGGEQRKKEKQVCVFFFLFLFFFVFVFVFVFVLFSVFFCFLFFSCQ